MSGIVVVARTLNEERYIERFIRGYEWADHIVLCDGGSTDKTLELAIKHPKVLWLKFDKQVVLQPSGRVMNPENAHANTAIDAARHLNADWIVLDDCDCVPNYLLREQARDIIYGNPTGEIYAYRLYMWKRDFYFPSMMVGKSLWAWNLKQINITANEKKDPFDIEYIHPHNWQSPRTELELPLCLLHDGWPDDARIEEKMKRYEAWGRPQVYPLDAFGPAELLPEYAHE